MKLKIERTFRIGLFDILVIAAISYMGYSYSCKAYNYVFHKKQYVDGIEVPTEVLR